MPSSNVALSDLSPSRDQTTMKTTSRYSSDDDGKIFQTKPPFNKPSQFRAKGWTETEQGYISEAKQMTMCLLRNRRYMRRPYTWAVHININEVLPPDAIASMWPPVCRNLRRNGVVCLWVREPNRRNTVHYHLVVKNHISRKQLEQAIEKSMPSRSEVKWRKKTEEIDNEWRYCHYITKAKIKGKVKGKLVADMHRRKRRLFKAGLRFDKYGTVGNFWEAGKTKKKLWDEIKETEKRIAKGLEDPDVDRLVQHVFEMMGETVPKKRSERSFGYSADFPAVQDWISQLIATDWSDDPWLNSG
jgi:hypothetical protein